MKNSTPPGPRPRFEIPGDPPLKVPYYLPGREFSKVKFLIHERKSEQAHIHVPHAPTLLENAVYNEWQFQTFGQKTTFIRVAQNNSGKSLKGI